MCLGKNENYQQHHCLPSDVRRLHHTHLPASGMVLGSSSGLVVDSNWMHDAVGMALLRV